MEIPNLTLSIDEGPKKGATFDRRPGSFICIGRVVRGNTLAVKDPGISQKHLIVEFHSQISRWAVTDLGTSNGTTVNGALISPNTAFPLADGDIIKIGENTLMSVKISAPSAAPEPRTRRGRRVAAAASLSIEKDVKEKKVNESADVVDAVKIMAEEGKRGRLTRASAKSRSARCPKENEKALEPVVEEDCGSASGEIERSGRALKEKNGEREGGHEKVEGKSKNGGKGMGRARVLRKGAPSGPVAVEQKGGRDVKALSAASSAMVLIMKEEEGETLERIKGLVVNDGKGGRARGKRGDGSSMVLWKGDVLEPVVAEDRRRRVTRASTMAMSSSAWVSKVLEGEDEEIKEKVEEPANNGGKQRAKGKRGGRSSRISRKVEELESVAIGEKVEGSLSRVLDVVVASSERVPKDLQKKKMMAAMDLNSVYLKGQEKKKSLAKSNASGDGKKLAMSREVRFRIEEAENDKDIMMSGESNKTEDVYFPRKEELAFSWSSFSEIRGIPNTTSKYREDKMINCHATPFEARVERALNRGIAETSSSTET